jgi:hypothetical protein
MPGHPTTSRRLYLETFLVALAVILLEVSYTRVFSYKLVYYFTYLIIGISLLGLGAGGVFVAIFTALRRLPVSVLIPFYCLAAGASVFGGYLVVARTQLNAFEVLSAPGEVGKLVLICGSLFVPFLAGGLALATIFSTQTERINRLYFADLLGAGLGCAICVPLMTVISPPGCVMLAGAFFALGGLRLAAVESRNLLLVPLGGVLLALLGGAVAPSRLPDPVPDSVKTMSPQLHRPEDVLFSRWSPVFRVDVLRTEVAPDTLLLSHDGMWGSVIRRSDGNPASATHYDTDERAHPFRLLGPGPRVAIVGSAGGNEVLASLHFGASHVTGIELNPVTNSLLETHFADYSGHLARNPRVTLVNAEARSFLASSDDRYDLIWLVAPDSYAAMNAATSGAFVLSESYLYTVEMIVDSLEHLTEDGILCAQFGEVDFDLKPNRTVRYLGTAREAFRRLGIEDFDRHVLVGTAPGFGLGNVSTILLRRAPFTDGDVARFADSTARIPGARVRFAWTQRDDRDPPGPVEQVISLDGEKLAAWYAGYPFEVKPVFDDSPFFWHFVPFGRLADRALRVGEASPEEGKGERLLVVLLFVATAFAAFFLLAPLLLVRGVWGAIPYKMRAGVYFAALGIGFMFFEVSLIQRLTLFLGYPTYSLTVTLFALLVFTGFGSLASEGYGARRNQALLALAAVLTVLVLFYQIGMTPIVTRGIGWPFGVRVAVAVAFLAPLGLCLGVFMPLGLRTVSSLTPYGEEFVAWSWAVNGFFSVVSSVLATIVSMTAGFTVVMLAALVVYWTGIAAMLRVPVPE